MGENGGLWYLINEAFGEKRRLSAVLFLLSLLLVILFVYSAGIYENFFLIYLAIPLAFIIPLIAFYKLRMKETFTRKETDWETENYIRILKEWGFTPLRAFLLGVFFIFLAFMFFGGFYMVCALAFDSLNFDCYDFREMTFLFAFLFFPLGILICGIGTVWDKKERQSR